MIVFQPKMIDGPMWTGYAATWFALAGLSALGAGSIFKLFFVKEED